MAAKIHLNYLAARKKLRRSGSVADQALLNLKLELTRQLLDLGYSDKNIPDLFRFLDWIIELPEELDAVYYEESKEVMEEIMAFIFTPERVGLRRGLKEGMEKGRLNTEQSILMRLLEHKFGITEQERALILATEDSEVLERALDKVVDATSKDQVLGTLESPKK
jgi:hypothetical protein